VPAVLAIPTGVGKTGIALAIPFILNPRRLLVLVPSVELRAQLHEAFATQQLLVDIGALSPGDKPTVISVTKTVRDWRSLETADVVIGLPNLISPASVRNPPPADFFDLIVVDEAHHAPARTWTAVLLTATPRRRDGKRLPGEVVYHYPLRQALSEGVYKPIVPALLPAPIPFSSEAADQSIAAAVVALLALPDHQTSTVLVRSATIKRAERLAGIYRGNGIQTSVLHSNVGPNVRKALLSNLRAGRIRAVAVVGMLGEGFDLPSIRILAYHDKHKSAPAALQLIGRLARADARFPQPSTVVTTRDADVYPELAGIVRRLYEDEDPDWARVLPGLIDDQIAAERADGQYAQSFSIPPPFLSLQSVTPLRRVVAFEATDSTWAPDFASAGRIPGALRSGSSLRGSSVIYSGIDRDHRQLVLVTQAMARPAWHDHPGLDYPEYDLHVVSYCRPTMAAWNPLILINSDDGGDIRALRAAIDPSGLLREIDPTQMNEAFDSLDRKGVTSVGVRNTYLGPGIPAYQIYSGTDVDRGIREGDVSFGALGHAIVQLDDGTAAGFSSRKGKYWENEVHTAASVRPVHQ
jgi:superfamily II DNA or RNA helicase